MMSDVVTGYLCFFGAHGFTWFGTLSQHNCSLPTKDTKVIDTCFDLDSQIACCFSLQEGGDGELVWTGMLQTIMQFQIFPFDATAEHWYRYRGM